MFFLTYPIMVKCLNIGKNIGKPIYRSISSQYDMPIYNWLTVHLSHHTFTVLIFIYTFRLSNQEPNIL